MISLIFIALAAFSNATMDTLTHHFSTSIFRNMNPKVWNPNESHLYAYSIPLIKVKIDPWHIFKYGMILGIVLAWVFGATIFSPRIDFLIGCFIWWLIFEFSYGYLLLKKK